MSEEANKDEEANKKEEIKKPIEHLTGENKREYSVVIIVIRSYS